MKLCMRIIVILIKLSQLVALIALVRCFGPQGAEHIRASTAMLAGRLRAASQTLLELCRAASAFLFKRKREVV